MEDTPRTQEVAPGLYSDLIDLIVEEGIVSLRNHEGLREECLRGGVEGFEQCRAMRGLGVVDFELALIAMNQVNKDNKNKLHDEQISREDYWRHRYALLQVEHCYEILRVAHLARTGSLPDGRRDYSAQSAVRYEVLALKLKNNNTPAQSD